MGSKNYIPLSEAFLFIRNLITSELARKTGVPISNTDEQDPTALPPYGYYAIVTPFTTTGESGDYKRFVVVDEETKENYIEHVRSENASATFSYTFCSITRGTREDGDFVHGDTEAQSLAMTAVEWLSHEGRDILSLNNIVVKRIGSPNSRSGIVADEYNRRWGFDLDIGYTAQMMKRDELLMLGVITDKKEE